MRPALAVIGLVAVLGACDSAPQPIVSAPITPGPVVMGPTDAASGPWTVDLRTGVGTVHIALADLPGPLYRIAVPTGSGSHPVASVSGTTLGVDVIGGSTSIDITLNKGTPWNVRLSAGASTLTVDAADGTLTGLETLAGVSSVDVTAAAPHGITTMRDVGGSSSLDLHVPDGTGVRVHAIGGAGSVSLFGTTHEGVAGGSQFETPGFGADGYLIDAEAGVSSIAVDSGGP